MSCPDDLAAWAASGAMALTGRPDGRPLGPPGRLVPGLRAVAARLAADSGHLGRSVRLDPLALLGERAALRGLSRGGAVSCGGHTRLLPAGDGWVALSLARPEDVELIPAWLELSGPAGDPWAIVAGQLSTRDAESVVARGRLLGLPVAAVGAVPAGSTVDGLPIAQHEWGSTPARESLAGLRVVDLSALWAGPLCASLMSLAGAEVVKVESRERPDGLRRGDPALFDLLNAGKRSVALDLGRPAGVADLRRLLASADVVVEASRPRALEQWGISAERWLAAAPRPKVWVSITGYGRRPPGRDWVAFGDDAAAAGGLLVADEAGPCFCADAVADPVTGLVAAVTGLAALRRDGRWLIDVAMARVAASLAGPAVSGATTPELAPPRARAPQGPARALGADNVAVMSTLD